MCHSYGDLPDGKVNKQLLMEIEFIDLYLYNEKLAVQRT